VIPEILRFLTYLEQTEDYSANTMANYRINMRLFSEWIDSQGKTIATVTHADMREYRDGLKAKYKPGTVNKKLAYASKFFGWCYEQGLISQNPMTKIKWVKSQDYPKWLNQEQVTKLLEVAQREIDQARGKGLGFTFAVALKVRTIFVVLLNTGLRVSELCDLKLSDIQGGVITVQWGKGSKRREVPINEQAQGAFDCWLQVRRSESDFVFVTSEGRMGRKVVHWHIVGLGKAVGIGLKPHMLRHTFGKMLADKGVGLDRIAKLMGHSNINTTAIYTMPSLADLREVVGLLD
jgi:site-specific recombinase XerD